MAPRSTGPCSSGTARRCRIIYVTGQAHSMDYAGFLAASRVPVISKPFSPDDLRKAVRGALDKGTN